MSLGILGIVPLLLGPALQYNQRPGGEMPGASRRSRPSLLALPPGFGNRLRLPAPPDLLRQPVNASRGIAAWFTVRFATTVQFMRACDGFRVAGLEDVEWQCLIVVRQVALQPVPGVSSFQVR